MKKIFIFILAIVMILSMSVSIWAMPGEEHLTRKAAVREIIKELYKTDSTDDFAFEENYCVHESGAIHFVPVDAANGYPVLCEIYNVIDSSGFSDVSGESDDEIFISLAKAMGIINGNGDNTFSPDRDITYSQAVKMFVCTVGYGDQLAKERGGYPDGYIAAAEEFGITKGMDYNDNDPISRKDFEDMLSNCIILQSMPVNVFSIEFVPATTPELCVNQYAQAVKDRCGTLQYALLDEALRSETRADFEGFYWVTGVSSPWVSGYEIQKIDDLVYEITFHYATSTGAADDMVVKVTLKRLDVFQITELDFD